MFTQKIALIGCKSGPWVNTSNLHSPRLRVKGPGATRVQVEQVEKEGKSSSLGVDFVGPGDYEIPIADWTRVTVVEGDSSTVLCFIFAGESDAVSAA